MATFEEFMKVAEISSRTRLHKRMNEIVRIMRQYKVLHGLTPAQAVESCRRLSHLCEDWPAGPNRPTFRLAYCDAFEKLRDDANPMPRRGDEQIDRAYGKSCTRCSPPLTRCLWARPIAQVHKATLLDGTTVA
ncbi:MAG: hypothetical protein ACLUVF_10015 [Adlercreutzia sp.]